jgi:transposase-like protein
MATRRTHPLEFKRSAVKASNQPGASIAGVAMAHGINANQLHKWAACPWTLIALDEHWHVVPQAH